MNSCTSRRRFLSQAAAAVAGTNLVRGVEARHLQAGASKRRVTPPLAIPFLTSSGNGTNAPFQGVHDDLFARALVIHDGKQAIAVLAVDAIGYDNAVLGPGRDFTAELRKRVSARTDIAP